MKEHCMWHPGGWGLQSNLHPLQTQVSTVQDTSTMLLSGASGSNVKVLSGSLRKIVFCQNYSAKPSAKPRCCSAMKELQDSLFKGLFSSFPMSWIPEKPLLTPGFSWRSLGISHMTTGKPIRGTFLYRVWDQSWTPHPQQSKGHWTRGNSSWLTREMASDSHNHYPWAQAGQKELVGQPWGKFLLEQGIWPPLTAISKYLVPQTLCGEKRLLLNMGVTP